MKRIILVLSLAILLTSCSIYKKYSRPEEISTDKLYGNIEKADTTTMADISWREFFTDKHNQTCLEVDVVLYAHHSSKEERAHQTKRYRKDYRQRNHIALVQTRQDEVDKQDTDAENDGSIVAFGLLLTSNTGVVVAISHR